MELDEAAETIYRKLSENLVEFQHADKRLICDARNQANVPSVERDLNRLHNVLVQRCDSLQEIAANRQLVIDRAEAEILPTWRSFADRILEKNSQEAKRRSLMEAFSLVELYVQERLDAFEPEEFQAWCRLLNDIDFEFLHVSRDSGFSNAILNLTLREYYYDLGYYSTLREDENTRLKGEWVDVEFATLIVPQKEWEDYADELGKPDVVGGGLAVFMSMQAPAHQEAIEFLTQKGVRHTYIVVDGLVAALGEPRGIHRINDWLLGDESRNGFRVAAICLVEGHE